jgi:NodT family efflux transporter outer membrane factor (OMF) lipoprotein
MNALHLSAIWHRISRTASFAMCLVGPFAIVGCTVGPKYQRPAVDVPPAYKELGDWKTAQPNEQNLGGAWWQIFQDPQLNRLEDQINVSNQNLKAAVAQYTQARAALRYYRADYYPSINGGAAATRNRISNNRPPAVTTNGSTYNDFQIPVELSYEADVWGRVRKTVESQRGQAQASAADLATVNLSLHAQLALFYFQGRSLDAQEQLLSSTVAQYEKAWQLVKSQFQGGLASDVEVQQASTQLETTRAQAIDVGVLRAQYEHAIATLIGKPASSFGLSPLPLTSPPPSIPLQVPSKLLERRPDIAAAERRMAAANAQIGVAKAAYYPTISLGATGGFESGTITTLLSGPSVLWSAGASAVAPLFDAGRRRANLDQATAAYDETVANYRETVLNGFQQVEDNLAALRILEKEADTQQRAVVAAEKSLALSLIRYRGGITSYLEVTVAQSAALSDEVTAVDILGRRMTNAVLLIQALGGGWDRSSLPERPECCGPLTSTAVR